MKREENPGSSSAITLIILGVGGYFLYNYLVSSGLWAQWFGGATAGAGATNLNTIAAGIQSGAFVAAGTDAQGNTIVHQVSTGQYFAVNPTSGAVSAASGPGSAGGSGSTVPVTVPVTTPPATSGLQSQLQNAANQFMANTGAGGLNIDQWVFYYQTIRGTTLSGAQVESLIQAAGLNDASRGTIIPLSTFMNALGGVGLSGIVSVPNGGPIAAPLPTQSFNRGFGGYGANGRLIRGNSYVQ